MAVPKVISIAELLLGTLEWCDIQQVAAVSAANNYCARVGEKHMQGRIHSLIVGMLGGKGECGLQYQDVASDGFQWLFLKRSWMHWGQREASSWVQSFRLC